MTARPEDQPMPLDEGHDERTGLPRGAEADDGQAGGQTGGARAPVPHVGDGAGTNMQSGAKSGSENERVAPGMSTEKKADDTK